MDLLIFGLSHHFHEPREHEEVAIYREFNPGLGIQLRRDEDPIELTLTAGAYLNSYARLSAFVGPGFRTKGNLGFEFSGALLTGYNDIPIFAPIAGVFYRYDRVTVHVNYMEALVLYVGIEL